MVTSFTFQLVTATPDEAGLPCTNAVSGFDPDSVYTALKLYCKLLSTVQPFASPAILSLGPSYGTPPENDGGMVRRGRARGAPCHFIELHVWGLSDLSQF